MRLMFSSFHHYIVTKTRKATATTIPAIRTATTIVQATINFVSLKFSANMQQYEYAMPKRKGNPVSFQQFLAISKALTPSSYVYGHKLK